MPIPGSVLNDLLPFGVDGAAAAYPSTATFRPLTKATDTTGEETRTFVDSTDPGLSNLRCRKSPLIQVRPQNQETDSGGINRFDAKFQVNFMKPLSAALDIMAQYQIKVDGVVYQVLAAEPDGMGITSRVLISDAVNFVA